MDTEISAPRSKQKSTGKVWEAKLDYATSSQSFLCEAWDAFITPSYLFVLHPEIFDHVPLRICRL